MNNYTPRSRVVLAEINEPVNKQPMDETRDNVAILDTPQDTTHEMSSTEVPCQSGRIVRPTQKEGIDYNETFSLVAMLKSIRIILFIAAQYDYDISQMDVKIAFLNGNLEEEIYMMQPEGFIAKNQEHMVCKLKRSIYELKQASRPWNIRFDQAIKSFGFEQNIDEPCVYKRHQDKVVMFLVLLC